MKESIDTDWIKEARFGLFIHWGLYSVPARQIGKDSTAEWVKSKERLSDEEYEAYFAHFDPDLYDPVAWARQARAAGMRYFVVTTKHHEGFCLWDSQLTDYKATNTPAGRDLLGPMVEAFAQRVCGWASIIPYSTGTTPTSRSTVFTRNGMTRSSSGPILKETLRSTGTTCKARSENCSPSTGRSTICSSTSPTRPIVTRKSGGEKAVMTGAPRSCWPWCASFNQGSSSTTAWSFLATSPRRSSTNPPVRCACKGANAVWEANQTLNGSFGYDRDNLDWKPPELLVKMLVDGVSKDGNLLLNVGPTARGEFDDRAVATLRRIGRWMYHHGRSVYGCGPAPFVAPPDCRYTMNGKHLFLHMFSWPFGHLHLPGLAERVEFARFLHDGSEIQREVIDSEKPAFNTTLGGQAPGTLTLRLPVHRPEVEVPVIELLLR